MKRVQLATVALASALAAGGSVSAQTPARSFADDGAPPIIVRYSDLDLTHEPGARVLIARIRQAADTYCGHRPSSLLNIGDRWHHEACVRESMIAAVKQVNAPLVTALYSGPDRQILARR